LKKPYTLHITCFLLFINSSNQSKPKT
jgi:hypothetical protein